eukprot:snap_masked-scaffold_29-processed-gene-0.24-mRNA-1 protein AED:1.00 eAED:1.00 QI:0/-1/0/0/-1/1/1/0/308
MKKMIEEDVETEKLNEVKKKLNLDEVQVMPKPIQKSLKTARNIGQKLLSDDESYEFTSVLKNEVPPYEVFTAGDTFVKFKCVLTQEPQTVFAALTCRDLQKKYDPNRSKFKEQTLVNYAPTTSKAFNSKLVFRSYKAFWPIGPRHVLLVQEEYEISEHEFMLLMTSVEDSPLEVQDFTDQATPKNSRAATCEIFMIHVVKSGENLSSMTYVANVDVKHSIPPWMSKYMIRSVIPQFVHKLFNFTAIQDTLKVEKPQLEVKPIQNQTQSVLDKLETLLALILSKWDDLAIEKKVLVLLGVFFLLSRRRK